MVADAFAEWLASPRFAGCFSRVLFAVYERAREKPNESAFRARFRT
jgi:hypothetical protein